MAYLIDNVSSNDPTNGFSHLLNNNFINYINGDKTKLTNGLEFIHTEIKKINTITKDGESIIENTHPDKINKIGFFAGLIYYKLALLCMKALNDVNKEWEKVIAQLSKFFFPTTNTPNLSKFYINPTNINDINSIDNLVIYQLLQQLIAKDMNPNIDDVMIFMSKIDDKSIQKLEHKRKIFDMLEKDGNGIPIIKYYKGDPTAAYSPIGKKIKKIYEQVSVPGARITKWNAHEISPDMEFFYIEGKEAGETELKIVSIVRICNAKSGDFPLEIGFDVTLKNFQGAGLYELTSKKRLNYITLEKNEKYVSYTKFDELRALQISFGMTFVVSTLKDGRNDGKFLVNGEHFWKLEFNSFKLLGIKQLPPCNGIHICNATISSVEKGVLLTAGHCLYHEPQTGSADKLRTSGDTFSYYDNKSIILTALTPIKNYYNTVDNANHDLSLFSIPRIENCKHIYILENPHDLPANMELAFYANAASNCGEWCNDFFKTFDINNINLVKVKKDFQTIFNLQTDEDKYKELFVPVSFNDTKKNISNGDSGGIVGVIFNDIKFAIIGLIAGGAASKSHDLVNRVVNLTNVSQIIGDPDINHIQYNIARYDTTQKKIIITRQSQN